MTEYAAASGPSVHLGEEGDRGRARRDLTVNRCFRDNYELSITGHEGSLPVPLDRSREGEHHFRRPVQNSGPRTRRTSTSILFTAKTNKKLLIQERNQKKSRTLTSSRSSCPSPALRLRQRTQGRSGAEPRAENEVIFDLQIYPENHRNEDYRTLTSIVFSRPPSPRPSDFVAMAAANCISSESCKK